MWYSDSKIKVVVICVWLFIVCCSTDNNLSLASDKYIVTAEEDALSERWAEYFCNHILKRTDNPELVELHKGAPLRKISKGVKHIHFEVASDLKYDYCVKHTSRVLHIRVKNDKTALWIVYQLIEKIAAENPTILSDDLPPAIINFNTNCVDFDFKYREPFYSANLVPEYAQIIGTNSLDTDWGIWGHNLGEMVDNPENENIYALVGNERVKEQFCFSSPELFSQLEQHILDYYGEGDKGFTHFMIMPNDNDFVCTCPTCTQLGNNKNNSTPSVYHMLNKLSERFPKHQFFTTVYRTTVALPDYSLPKNSGVFFSTINLPKGVALGSQPRTRDFVKQLHTWKSKTSEIYLWDYTANFDDYLTPIPILFGLQTQLKFFKEQGVKGVFLNASGYDYSPFDDVKTYVAGALLMDFDIDVETLIRTYYQKMYPLNYELISNYYVSLEKNFFEKNSEYNMYGGMRDNIQSYLDMSDFISFYESLGKAIPLTLGEEREKLEKLYTALTFTRLQIAYTQGYNQWGYGSKQNWHMVVKPEMSLLVDKLRKFDNYNDLQNYKEADGSISMYVDYWEQLLKYGAYENGLLGKPVVVLSKRGEGFETTALLTDGTPGFNMDYHQGWYLSGGDDLHIRFSAKELQDAKLIRLRFLHMAKHSIYYPESIKLIVDGKAILNQQIIKKIDSYSLPINFSGVNSVELIIKREKKAKSILALDEVQVIK